MELNKLRLSVGSPSYGDLAKITAEKVTGPLSPRALAKDAGIHAKPRPLAKSTISDLVNCHNAKAPDSWTLSMYVLACVSWGAHHGCSDLELTPAALRNLLKYYQQLRLIYEEILEYDAAGSKAAESTSGVRIGLPPQLPADHFQRRGITLELDRTTCSGATIVLPGRTTVLEGTGGVGKTELAADFARRIWKDERIRLAMWIPARSRDAVVTAYATAATQLHLAESSVPPGEAAGRLLAWLAEGSAPWAIVLDDLRRPEDLTDLWPVTGGTGRVVVTTRWRDLSPESDGVAVVPVDVFTPAESDSYLQAKLARMPDLAEGAGPLADALGHLPLALAQAVAYQLNRGLTCRRYLDRFDDNRKALDDVAPEHTELPDGHRQTVAATWALSVELADELPPAGLARPLLSLGSVLEPAGTPRCIFSTAPVLQYLGEHVGRDVDSNDAHGALEVLHSLNLLTVEAGMVRTHTLVQRTTREAVRRPESGAEAWHRLIRAAADAIVDAGNLPWLDRDLQGRMLRCARTLIAHGDHALWEPDGHPVLYGLGEILGQLGHVQLAADHFLDLAGTAAERLGPDHADTLLARAKYAGFLAESGHHERAAAELEQVIADQTRVRGEDGVENFDNWANLSTYRGEAGDPEAAVRGFERLVERRTQAHGRDSQETLITRANLARWRGEAGDKRGALREHVELVPLFARAYGPHHPRTIKAMGERASWLAEVDPRAGMAELQRLLAVKARVFGPYDTATLHTRRNLGWLRGLTGQTERAISDLTGLVADYGKHVNPDHPGSLRARHDLSLLLQYAGEHQRAHAVLTDLLADQTRLLGPSHHSTLVTAENLRLAEEQLARPDQ